jgi:RecA-family ATPase
MRRDLNEELRVNGADAVRARMDNAKPFRPKRKEAPRGNGGERDFEARIGDVAKEIELNLIQAGELLKTPAPPRNWFCYPWMPQKEVILLSGDGGIGKSTLAVQAGISSALGIQWLGYDIMKGRTLILSCEDGRAELHYRLEQIVKQESPYALQDALEALMSIFIIDATRDIDPTLATYDEREGVKPTTTYEAIKAAIRQNHIDLLILDSAADLFAEEINRHAVRSFIRLLRELDCTVILLAHPSAAGLKDGRGYSGSTHWNNSVRARLYFRKAETKDGEEPDPDLRILEMPKNNRARADAKIFLRWEDDRFVRENANDQSLEKLQNALKVEELYLQLLSKFNEQSQRVSPKKSPTYAPKLFNEHSDGKDISVRRFAQAQQTLLDAHKIKIVEGGSPSKPRTWLEVAP